MIKVSSYILKYSVVFTLAGLNHKVLSKILNSKGVSLDPARFRLTALEVVEMK